MRIDSAPWRAPLLAAVMWLVNSAAFAQQGTGATQQNIGIPPDSAESIDPKTGDLTAGKPIEGFLKQQLPPLPPDAPKPAADPHDFAGVWFHDQVGVMRINFDQDHQPVPFTEKGERIRDRRVKAGEGGSPYIDAALECLPPGQPWELELTFPFRIFQTDRYLVFAFEEYHVVWNIQMSDHHQTDGTRQYMGDSIGHWEGNTLVVDTIDYKAAFWIDGQGTPMSKNGHLIQRIRRVVIDGGPKLLITTTVDDKDMYTRPWSFTRTFAWRPDHAHFAEFNCDQQASAPDGISRYGAVPEPAYDQ